MTVWQWIGDALWHLIPPAAVLGLFVLLIRSIVRADRNERDAYSKIEAEMRAEQSAKKPAKKPAK